MILSGMNCLFKLKEMNRSQRADHLFFEISFVLLSFKQRDWQQALRLRLHCRVTWDL